MYDFTQNKANKNSIAHRNPIFGFGINDASYVAAPKVAGKQILCPIYRKWHNMLKRCYSEKNQEKQPTYQSCYVADEWLTFSAFRNWMITQNHEGLELDKDIKFKGNKIYSAKTCIFIPKALNQLLNDHAAKRGDYPVGVCFHKASNKFQADIACSGKSKYLGLFSTPSEASQAYQTARTSKIQQLIDDNVYPDATEYLAQHMH